MTLIKNISQINFDFGAIHNLNQRIYDLNIKKSEIIIFVDIYFKNKLSTLSIDQGEYGMLFFYDTKDEPTVEVIDDYVMKIRKKIPSPSLIVAIGGGSTLDTGKAVSNLITNHGKAEDYQGWDLLTKKGIYKIGIPTISGTGAESSRTCVMINKKRNIKMGMNSNFSVYDELILDPNITSTVPFNQFFYTAMDTYIHSIESLNGNLRNPFSDSFSNKALSLCRDVFLDVNPKSDTNREKLMLASYFGGVAIANSMVGIIHPFSAGLSSVFGTHHCLANCIVMKEMEEFYPKEVEEFNYIIKKLKIDLPRIKILNEEQEIYKKLYEATIIHERPLKNALGDSFKAVLDFDKVTEIFKKILR